MNFFDNHTHSEFSPDSRMTMEQDIAVAVSKGLGGIAITDHLDLDVPRDSGAFAFDIAEQQKKIAESIGKIDETIGIINDNQKRKKKPFKVLRGIEVGLQPVSIRHTLDYVAPFKFDTVIASIHFVDGLDPYFGSYYKGKTPMQAYGRTFELMLSTALEYEDFDILGHFDYVARYAPYDDKNVTYKEFAGYLEPLLKFLAENGKALEINTKSYEAGVSHGVGTANALKFDLNILRKFRDFGGEAVSLGSDAHDPNRVGDNFKTYWQMVQHCGFKYLCYFERRKPVFYRPE